MEAMSCQVADFIKACLPGGMWTSLPVLFRDVNALRLVPRSSGLSDVARAALLNSLLKTKYTDCIHRSAILASLFDLEVFMLPLSFGVGLMIPSAGCVSAVVLTARDGGQSLRCSHRSRLCHPIDRSGELCFMSFCASGEGSEWR